MERNYVSIPREVTAFHIHEHCTFAKVYAWLESKNYKKVDWEYYLRISSDDLPMPKRGYVQDPDFEMLRVFTNQGPAEVNPGDYLIEGLDGEIYPCSEEVFEKTYSPSEK